MSGPRWVSAPRTSWHVFNTTNILCPLHGRRSLRERFPGKLWLDVLSKADLLEEEFDAAGDVDAATAHQAAEQAAGPDDPPPSSNGSASDGNGSMAAVRRSSATADGGQDNSDGSQLPMTAGARTVVWGGTGAGRSGANDIGNAVQMAAALPHALRVSATSGFGVDDLKVLPWSAHRCSVGQGNMLVYGNHVPVQRLASSPVAPARTVPTADRRRRPSGSCRSRHLQSSWPQGMGPAARRAALTARVAGALLTGVC